MMLMLEVWVKRKAMKFTSELLEMFNNYVRVFVYI